ncbi:ABC transporter ATP-binding protein [Telmatocola sphagniphila]|uniref:ABC transporter ATP-binding protein n=1 Tax=Telmatocola sphagniphila TaxID=1123043 RepID=UPI001FE35187|nr:ABC transporter ATP-binding protein [Telmatocola sphagniphila]
MSKIYGSGWPNRYRIPALDKISLHIESGTCHALLGPNRSGKTTFVKLLLGLCKPTEGEISRLGDSPKNKSTLAKIGYVHENQLFPRYLTARELLRYYGSLSLIPQSKLNPKVDALLKKVGLADRATEPISRFSKGMIQRLGLAQSLLNDPELLILDEPTEGLDLSGRQLLRDVVHEQKKRGATTLLISHVFPEVEQLCDRVTVLVAGQVAKQAEITDLLRDPKSGQPRSLEDALRPLYKTNNP